MNEILLADNNHNFRDQCGTTQALKSYGCSGEIHKCGAGNGFMDPRYKQARSEATQIPGWIFCPYFWLTPDDASDQWALAQHYMGSRVGLGPLFLDVENNRDYSPWDTMENGHQVCADKVTNYQRLALATGHACGTYMDKDYIENVWPLVAEDVRNHPNMFLWVAAPGSVAPGHYDLWQYTWTAPIAGQQVDISKVNPLSRLAKILGGEE